MFCSAQIPKTRQSKAQNNEHDCREQGPSCSVYCELREFRPVPWRHRIQKRSDKKELCAFLVDIFVPLSTEGLLKDRASLF